MDNNEIILHLSLIDGVGQGTIDSLITHKPWDLELHDLYHMTISEITRLFSITLAKAEAIAKGLADRELLDHELELIHRYKINWMTFYHDNYPILLKNIHLAPTIVYWQGALPADGSKSIAIIGSRNINYYGISVIESFVPTLVTQGWTVVSGGAVGADAAAHRVTVDSGGHTIAILGSGLLNVYPVSNKRLFADIVDAGGTLMSTFRLTTAPAAGNFPARNRIIAGMSRGCLVVQAGRQSGTRITAHYALEQGRELFAVPGPIDEQLCAGCHELIQQGAKLVTSVADILVELGHSAHEFQAIPKKISKPEACEAQAAIPFKAVGNGAVILRCCTQSCSLDELAQQTGLAMPDLYAQLFELELSGLIKQHANGMWQRN